MDNFEAVIEVPKGSRNKYEMNHETGNIELDRVLFTATFYPAEYGFIPETLAGDGDPLDVLVLTEEPTFPGCHVRFRPVGVFWMNDEKGPDAKILGVPAHDPRVTWQDLEDVPEHVRLEIGHFFSVYKDLEPGKSTNTRGWGGKAAALAEIDESRHRYRESNTPSRA
jgi:inorganic pyrophosphatase